MKWKEGSGRDLKPDSDMSPLKLENLELVILISLSLVKLVHLEQASWGEDSGSISIAGLCITLSVKLRYI